MRVDTGSRTRRDSGHREGPGPARCTASEAKSKLSAPLLEHAGEGVKLLGDAAGLPDDIGEGEPPDRARAAGRERPPPAPGGALLPPPAPGGRAASGGR